jgi:hypothetical protein
MPVRPEFGEHIGDGESGRIGIREDAGDERPEATSTFLRRPGCRRPCGADERSDAAARFENARALEIRVYAGDRIRIDAEFDGKLADGRELVARPQPARGDGGAKAALELRIERRAVARIDGNDAHRIILMY